MPAKEFGQFDQGAGQKYAPKPKKKPRVVSPEEPVYVNSDVRSESEEDELREVARVARQRVLRGGLPK